MPERKIADFTRKRTIREPALVRATKSRRSSLLIDGGSVANILSYYLDPVLPHRDRRPFTIVADERYSPVDARWLITAITTDPVVAPKSYINDVFDCDDYVMYVKTRLSLLAQQERLAAPYAVGFILTIRHAFNFCITTDDRMVLINTQSDDRRSTGDARQFARFLEVSEGNPIQFVYI